MKSPLIYVIAGLVGLVLVAAVSSGMTLLVMKSMIPRAVPAGEERGGYAAASGGSTLVESAEVKEVALAKFVTNLADEGGAVDVTLVLMVRSEKDAQRVEKLKNQIRDSILGILRTKKSVELKRPDGKDTLAKDVLTKANEMLGRDTVTRVLVTDMVTQP